MYNNHLKKTSRDYVCPVCFERMSHCKCRVSSHHLIEIDFPIQNAIRILNKKGYRTMDCCSGHKTKSGFNSGYITFIKVKELKDYIEENGCPDGWTFDSNGIYTLRATTPNDENDLNNFIYNLNIFVEDLPYLNKNNT